MSDSAALADLSARFARFAEVECRGISPLYERLSRYVAKTPSLLEIAACARSGQQPPNLLFGAVHLLLQRDPGDPLAVYYASLTAIPQVPDDGADAAFEAFCVRHRAEIVAVVSTHLVQTNEPGRSAVLRLALAEVARALGAERIALLEVGASAGLNLIWDAYRVDYGEGRVVGPSGGVPLTSRLRPAQMMVPSEAARVTERAGIDLAPIDATDEASAAWLRALVWPEDRARRVTLDQALRAAAHARPRILAGDATRELVEACSAFSPGLPVCVFHSATLGHIPPAGREAFEEGLGRVAASRPVAWLSMEGPAVLPQYRLASPPAEAGGYFPLGLTVLDGGVHSVRTLAAVSPHGRWIEWYGDALPSGGA